MTNQIALIVAEGQNPDDFMAASAETVDQRVAFTRIWDPENWQEEANTCIEDWLVDAAAERGGVQVPCPEGTGRLTIDFTLTLEDGD